ncbi:hypothetical protein [Rhodococcus sp. T7]|uniref:hypothetical protein n=1 Tax=Rhodococcus sp. T7 TaxID=627444 RepID=UPI001F442507|nr:hypothetical protein [Rhodococcus sp. T7]
MALPPDREERRAASRRQSRINAVPAPLQPAVIGFAEHLVAGRDRARRTGTHPRGHATLEARLTALRDFTEFLTTRRGKPTGPSSMSATSKRSCTRIPAGAPSI